MGQLLKVTSVPMQTMRFSQNARLVPADHVDIERRKAMARHFAFHSRYSSMGNTVDLNYVNQVNRSFAGARTHSRPTGSAGWSAGPPPSGGRSAEQRPQAVSKENGLAASGSGPVSYTTDIPVSQISIPETQAAYTTQRGSFELRVATGELSYLPPMTMTIITQYPEIHFEYLGGFHYFPPPEDFTEGNMNLSI